MHPQFPSAVLTTDILSDLQGTDADILARIIQTADRDVALMEEAKRLTARLAEIRSELNGCESAGKVMLELLWDRHGERIKDKLSDS